MSQPRKERPRELGPYPRERVDVSQRQVQHNQRRAFIFFVISLDVDSLFQFVYLKK